MQRGTKHYGVGAAVTVTDRSSGSNVTTRLLADEFKELDAIARRYDVSRSALARQAIKEFLARSDKFVDFTLAPDAETAERQGGRGARDPRGPAR
jgi:predicted transcriptional regulator